MNAGDLVLLVERCRELAPAESVYLEEDFVINLLVTVVDFQMNTIAVVRAIEYYKANRWDEIRTMDDLQVALGTFADDQEGNTALAQHLWGYKLWTRAHMLRGLVGYFDGIGVRDQDALRLWAATSEFKADFEGRVKGLGYAVYQSLVMRQGAETVKPDVHIHRFVESAVGRSLSDMKVVRLVEETAKVLGIRARELDWRIWEASRSA